MKLIGFTPAWRGGWTWKCCWQPETRLRAEKKREGCPWLKSHQTVLDARNARVTASPCLLSSQRDRCTCPSMCALCVYHQVRERYLPCFRSPCPPYFQSTPCQPSQKHEASFAADGLIIAETLLTMAATGWHEQLACRLFCLSDWIVISSFYGRM